MIAAEGGDLDLGAVLADQHDAEVRAHQSGAGEQLEDLCRAGVGGDVVIRGSRPSSRSRTQPPTR